MFLGVALAFLPDVRAEEPLPTAFTQSEGFWRTEFVVPAPVGDVRAALADPIGAAKFSPDITSLTYLSRGECPVLRAQLTGIVDMSYDYKRCATKNGWHETLVSSAGFDSYEVTWELQREGAGTRVRYAIKVDPVAPAPDFLIVRNLKRSIGTIASRLSSFVQRDD